MPDPTTDNPTPARTPNAATLPDVTKDPAIPLSIWRGLRVGKIKDEIRDGNYDTDGKKMDAACEKLLNELTSSPAIDVVGREDFAKKIVDTVADEQRGDRHNFGATPDEEAEGEAVAGERFDGLS